MRRSRKSYRRAALKGWQTRRRKAAARSAAARKGWQTRKRKQKQAVPANREYFVVLLFQTRKRGKTVDRRLQEVIITLPDGATDAQVKKAYADWLLQNTNWKAQDIYRLVYAKNEGRRFDMRIIPRDQPTSEPAGTVKRNDARNTERKAAQPASKARRRKRH